MSDDMGQGSGNELVANAAQITAAVLGAGAAAFGVTYVVGGGSFSSIAAAYQSTVTQVAEGGATVLGVIVGAGVGVLLGKATTKVATSIAKSYPSTIMGHTATVITTVAGACLGPTVSRHYLLGGNDQQAMVTPAQNYQTTEAGNYKLTPVTANNTGLPALTDVEKYFEQVGKIKGLVGGKVSDASVLAYMNQGRQRLAA